MRDGWLKGSAIALRCVHCSSARWASVETMRESIEGTSYRCSCGERTPVDEAYYAAIGHLPFMNVHFICNYVWRRVEEDVPLGRAHSIVLPSPLDKMHYVNATANAAFPVKVAIVERSGSGFSIVAGSAIDNPSEQSVRVAWTAAGHVGPTRDLFFEAMGRAFEAFFQDAVRTPAMLRAALLETATAYETFAAWYLRECVWPDEFFEDSKNKADQISELVTKAGIASLTQVPIRVALRGVDLHRVFRALGLPTASGTPTRDSLLQDIKIGITARNAVAHKGLGQPEPQTVERFVRAVYFLMEAVVLNVGWREDAPTQDRHSDTVA
jgi:hypothetical protein